MNYTIEFELETDRRWIAEVPEVPWVMAYGGTRDEALALRVMADRLGWGE